MQTEATLTTDPVLAAQSALDGPAIPLRDKARDVASRFEELFVQQMVTAMRSSTVGEGGGMFGDSAGADTYGDWFDRCMAEHIAHGGGVGLARIIEKNIMAHAGEEQATHA